MNYSVVKPRKTISMKDVDLYSVRSRTRTSIITKKIKELKIDENPEINYLTITNNMFKDSILLDSIQPFCRSNNIAIHLLEWKDEFEAEEFLELFTIDKVDRKIYYRISNFFFRYYRNNTTRLPTILTELITHMKNEELTIDEYKQILSICLETTITLIVNYYKLPSLAMYFSVTKQIPPDNIYLYRGFYEGLNLEILDDANRQIREYHSNAKPANDPGPVITIHSILSTSIKLSIAYKFSSPANGTIWKIIVPSLLYENFKYAYIDKKITIDKDTIIDDVIESEFILNYGTKLIHIETKIINDTENGKIFTLQTFMFCDNDVSQLDSEIDNLNETIEKYIYEIDDFPNE